jgi:anaerobic nitric oxide reductase flavorubredoxin
MSIVKIAENIYWVGAVDWNVRSFHGNTYNTKHGTTYNAYLIIDDKITLVDTVYAPFTAELLKNISEIVDPAKIDNIIMNHVEPDHSGAFPEVLKQCPKAKVYGTAKCKEGLYRYYYVDMDFTVVKTGDSLKTGKKTLKFIEAPMLHWPDSMFTYVAEDELLMPNDAFGQHIATSYRFDDEINKCALVDEATKYFANILWPFSGLIIKKIEEIVAAKIPIKTIAPSHGIIWRKNPGEIISSYIKWANNETKKKVVICYETMWGATEKMALNIEKGLADSGVEVCLFDVSKTDHTQIIGQMLDAKGFLFGSSTHDNNMLPNMGSFMEFFKGLKPKGRVAAAFGSYGWAGGAVKEIETVITGSGIELAAPSISARFMPDASEITKCYEFGKEFAKKV